MSEREIFNRSWFFSLALFVGFAISALPALAYAGGSKGAHDQAHGVAEEHHAPALSSLFYPTVNFLLYAGLIAYVYQRVGRKSLIEQRHSLRVRLERAAGSIAEAQSALSQVNARLQDFAAEEQHLLAQMENEAQRIAENIVRKAEESAQGTLKDTQRRIQREVARAEAEVRSEMVKEASRLARERLAGLSLEDDALLRREALLELS